MGLVLTLTIPDNTTRGNPATTTLKVAPCLVKAVTIYFPPGCCGLVHVWIEYLAEKLWPYNPEGEFSADSRSIYFTPNLYLDEDPMDLTLVGYNEDDTYPHTVYCELDIEFMGSRSLDERSALMTAGQIPVISPPPPELAPPPPT